MSIQELLKSETNINITVSLKDLQAWHTDVIEDTEKKLKAIVAAGNTETYGSPKQVSEKLDVDLSTLWAWNKKGYLTHSSVGGKRRYKMSEVNALLEGRSK